MHFVLSLLLIGAVVAAWARACQALGRWQERRASAPSPDGVRRLPRQRAATPLPEGHRPPPGLGPLSPSERFLTSEATRGLRELQQFLLDQQTA